MKNNKVMERRPTHPGEMLREEYMSDYGLTVSALAKSLGVSRQTVNELVHERRSLSPEMAVRLAALFDDSPQSWIDLQRNLDLWEAEKELEPEIQKIKKTRPWQGKVASL